MRSGVWAVMRKGLFSKREKMTDVWLREKHTKVLDQSDVILVLDLDQSLGLDAPGRARHVQAWQDMSRHGRFVRRHGRGPDDVACPRSD